MLQTKCQNTLAPHTYLHASASTTKLPLNEDPLPTTSSCQLLSQRSPSHSQCIPETRLTKAKKLLSKLKRPTEAPWNVVNALDVAEDDTNRSDRNIQSNQLKARMKSHLETFPRNVHNQLVVGSEVGCNKALMSRGLMNSYENESTG
nr:hypothetical protein HmN_000399700 [Hymenolepis microstoma]